MHFLTFGVLFVTQTIVSAACLWTCEKLPAAEGVLRDALPDRAERRWFKLVLMIPVRRLEIRRRLTILGDRVAVLLDFVEATVRREACMDSVTESDERLILQTAARDEAALAVSAKGQVLNA